MPIEVENASFWVSFGDQQKMVPIEADKINYELDDEMAICSEQNISVETVWELKGELCYDFKCQ
jgi:hypothetical protein